MTIQKGDEIFRGCAAMGGSGETCQICGHSYKDHYHIRGKYVRVNETRTYVDATLLKQFNQAKDDEERTKILSDSLSIDIEKKQNEIKEIFKNITELIIKYQELGLPKNYLRLVESRLAQINLEIQTYSGDFNDTYYHELLKAKDDLETRIHYANNVTITSTVNKIDNRDEV